MRTVLMGMRIRPAHDDGNTPVVVCVGNCVGLSGVEQRSDSDVHGS